MNPMTGRGGAARHLYRRCHRPEEPQVSGACSRAALESGGTAESGGAQQVRVCSGATLPRGDKTKTYLLRAYGNTANSAHEMWDVTDPSKPTRINVIVSGLRGTHKSWWECDTGIAYLVSGQPGWRVPRMAKIYDLSDPAKPVFIRDFGLPGHQPGSTGTPPGDNGLHGPVSTGPKGNRVYFAYGFVREGVVQIVDRDKLLNGPKEPTEANLLYPQISRMDMPPSVGAHNVFPLLRIPIAEFAKEAESVRDMLVIVDEAVGGGCMATARAMMWIADITTETRPFGASNWTMPGIERQFLRARRTFRDALVARELHPDLLQPDHVHRALQRRHSRGGRAGSVPPEGNRLLRSGAHGEDGVHTRRCGPAVRE